MRVPTPRVPTPAYKMHEEILIESTKLWRKMHEENEVMIIIQVNESLGGRHMCAMEQSRRRSMSRPCRGRVAGQRRLDARRRGGHCCVEKPDSAKEERD